jgi:ribosomal RNA assembly protein
MSERNIRIKIPLTRVGALIGADGLVKQTIENQFDLTLEVESHTGNVELRSANPDPSLLLRARDVVLAIGRGFSPERAFKLFNGDLLLYIIDLEQFLKSPSDIQRVKSRVIGRRGKTRRIIEENTMTSISIYGDTIAIIGDVEHLDVAREAINLLMKGALHRSVYRFLERRRSELRKIEMELWKPTIDLSKTEEDSDV